MDAGVLQRRWRVVRAPCNPWPGSSALALHSSGI